MQQETREHVIEEPTENCSRHSLIVRRALLHELPLVQTGHGVEQKKDWDEAVIEYEKALDVDPNNLKFRMALQHAKLEASRVHFEKGKALLPRARRDRPLTQLAATELELIVKLDPTNQYAAVEYGKAVTAHAGSGAGQRAGPIDELKKTRQGNITKSAPPQLNPASDQPISLSFPRTRRRSRKSTARSATPSASTSSSIRPSRTTASPSS